MGCQGEEGPHHAEGVEGEGVLVVEEGGEEGEDVLCNGGVHEGIGLTLLITVL